MDYTYQDYYDLPEDEILHFLTYDNITTSSSYIRVDNVGNTFVSNKEDILYADWTSTDGYMKITTNYSHRSTDGAEKHYEVWARATWLKYPAIALRDAFVLGTSGTFDDSYDETGFVSQIIECNSGCSRHTNRFRQVSNTNTEYEDLTMTYDSFVPELHFTPISPRCDYCGGSASDYSFTAYIRYGMIADESVNIQAGYAHKTAGFGGISVGFDINGTPSFSASVSTLSEYIARPVTVSY